MAALGVVGSVHAIAVQQPRTCLRQIAVPVAVGALANVDALHLVPPGGVEQAQLDFLRVGGEQREIHTLAVPGGATRVRLTGPHRADQRVRLHAGWTFSAAAGVPVGCYVHAGDSPCGRSDTS